MLNKHHSQETKDKISKANIGRKVWNKGKHHSEETKRKICLAQIGNKHTIETKKK